MENTGCQISTLYHPLESRHFSRALLQRQTGKMSGPRLHLASVALAPRLSSWAIT
jgi:hypothetical protein